MGEVAAENIMGIPADYDEKTNPTCVYMEPEAASVGLTEEQAKAKGIDYKVGKFPMSANGKALILNGGEGLVKIIAGRQVRRGPGHAHHRAPGHGPDRRGRSGHRLEATIDELISTIHCHPTVTETMREAQGGDGRYSNEKSKIFFFLLGKADGCFWGKRGGGLLDIYLVGGGEGPLPPPR